MASVYAIKFRLKGETEYQRLGSEDDYRDRRFFNSLIQAQQKKDEIEAIHPGAEVIIQTVTIHPPGTILPDIEP